MVLIIQILENMSCSTLHHIGPPCNMAVVLGLIFKEISNNPFTDFKIIFLGWFSLGLIWLFSEITKYMSAFSAFQFASVVLMQTKVMNSTLLG